MLRPRCIGLMALAILGTPLVLLQSGLAGCVGGETAGVLFNLPPTPIITADVVRGVAPLTVRFSSDGSTDDGLIVGRFWDFGDGQTSEDISPSHTFTVTGDFTVTLTLTDEQGATGSRSIIIVVTEAPVARIVVDTRTAESAPAVINFDGSSSFDLDGEIVEYQWDFGDGSREFLVAVPHTYASSGTYHARLTVTDDKGVTGSDEVIISIGIREPEIEVRVPPSTVPNVVVSADSPLWLQAIFEVEAGVPYTLRAGLDGDRDFCQAQTVVFDANTGSTLLTITGHDDAVNAAVFSPDGGSILTGSEDGTLRLHDAVTGELEQEYTVSAAVNSVAFAPNGASFVYGQADGAVVVRARADGALVRQFAGHAADVNSVDFSPNGDQVISGGNDRHAIVWNLNDGSILRDFVHDLGVRAVAFSAADPALVATGSADNVATVWNVTSGAEVVTLNGHTDVVTAVAFAPPGGILMTGSADGTARVWTLAGELQQTFVNGASVGIASVALSPDGLLAATGGNDGVGRVWDLVTGQEQFTLEPLAVYEEPGGHLARSSQPCTSPISAVAFTPDGLSILAAVAARNDIRLDTYPPDGNDLNIAIPTPLWLNEVATLDGQSVAPGEYYLWAEVRTDRTPPQRDYATAVINVIAPFTETIDAATPVIPLVNDQAAVVVHPDADRQIFDLGPVATGDRVYASLLSVPGFGEFYQDDEFSMLMLDASEEVFAWFSGQPDRWTTVAIESLPKVEFNSGLKLIAGHNTSSLYVVIDRGESTNAEARSASFRLVRGIGALRRQQRVFLDFDYSGVVAVGGLPGVHVTPFKADEPGFRSLVRSRIQDLFAGFDVEVTDTAPTPPYISVYFGGQRPLEAPPSEYGFPNHIDARNDTLTGSAIVFTDTLEDEFGLTEALVGTVAGRQIGFLLGLHLTTGNNADIMGANADVTGPLQFEDSALAPVFGSSTPGTQDAPHLLNELVGPD
jgi:WD40 repeat protein/PKD repeat protein